MWPFLQQALDAAVVLFVIVEPFGAVPMFAVLASKRPESELPRIARRASLAGALLLIVFAFAGRELLTLLRLELDALRAAGGLVLLLTALDMLRAQPALSRCSHDELEAAASAGEDVAIVPLAMPLLAGPGAIATVVMLAGEHSAGGPAWPLALAIVLVFAASYAVLRAAVLVQRLIGTAALGALQRVLGLVLAAAAAQLVAAGLRGLLSG